jgi:superfamily I DNA/RNA helicase
MTLRELIERLRRFENTTWLDQQVYIRYDDDNLLHGQIANQVTVVTVQDQDGLAWERVVLNGTHKPIIKQ